jgi:hypothetical protein
MEINDPKSQNNEEQQNQKPEDFNQAGEIHVNPVTIKNEKEDDEEDMDSDEEDMDWDDDADGMDDYGSSTEKYGGYNGWSDDAIDDAFEGDPMNTWNVD